MPNQSRYLESAIIEVDDGGDNNDVPTKLVSNTPQTGRRTWLHITNMGTNTIYIGGSNVRAANENGGYPVPPQDLELGISGEKVLESHSGEVYAICADGESATVRVLSQMD